MLEKTMSDIFEIVEKYWYILSFLKHKITRKQLKAIKITKQTFFHLNRLRK